MVRVLLEFMMQLKHTLIKLQRNNLAESAMLIGLLPAPSAYSPISDIKYAKQRQKTVLTYG